MLFQRTDEHPISRWWWAIDKSIFFSVLAIMGIGMLMAFFAYPYVAKRIGLDGYYFTKRYLIYGAFGFFIFVYITFSSVKKVKLFSLLAFLGFLFLMALTPFIGSEVKGSVRWIDLGFFSLQPSEFMKIFFIIASSWFLGKIKSLYREGRRKAGRNYIFTLLGLLLLIIAFLVLQPDFGAIVTILIIFSAQVFIAGLHWKWVSVLAFLGVLTPIIAYNALPHVRDRIDRFLHPETADTYQIDTALTAIKKAGFFGGNSNLIKKRVPDVHTDFVFIAFVEEFGILFAILFVGVMFFIAIRGFTVLKGQRDDFTLIAGTGIMAAFLFQTFANISSNLGLIPTEGVTLPFVSYGGSSFLAFCIALGIFIALTRKNVYNIKESV